MSKSLQREVFWEWMLEKSDIYKWRIPRKFPQDLYPIPVRNDWSYSGYVLGVHWPLDQVYCFLLRLPHPMSQPPILHVIFPLSTPRRRLRAHGTVLVSREGTITSVEDLWSGYLLSRGAGNLTCGIQSDRSYFDSPNTGTRNLHFRYCTFFTLITKFI